MPFRTRRLNASKRTLQLFLLLLLLSSAMIAHAVFPRWWKHQTDGELIASPLRYGNTLVTGNTYGTVTALSAKTGKQLWNAKGQHAVSETPVVSGNQVIVAAEDGTLTALDLHSGNETWKFSNPGFYRFFRPVIASPSLVLVTDTAGSAFGLHARTGKLLWHFPGDGTKSPLGMNTPLIVRRGTAYLASADGVVYALHARTGAVRWKFDAANRITTDLSYDMGGLLLGTENGSAYVLDAGNGSVIWRAKLSSSVSCVMGGASGNGWAPNPLVNAAGRLFMHRRTVFLVTRDNTITSFDATTNRRNWQLDAGPGCPSQWLTTLFTTRGQSVIGIDSRTGAVRWSTDLGHDVLSPVSVAVQPLYIRALLLGFMVPTILAGDTNGTLHAINGGSGETMWRSHCNGYVLGAPVQNGGRLVYACTDGALHNVSLRNGKKSVPRTPVTIRRESYAVAGTDIQEFTVTHDQSAYPNPFEDVRVAAVFRRGDGDSVRIPGFYYDKDTWKVRFNPPKKGEWAWELSLATDGWTETMRGTLTSKTDTSGVFLSVDSRNPARITADGVSAFSGMGITDAIIDRNRNGSPLDDWATGDEASPPGRITTLDAYLTAYGPRNGGFTLFRWSIDNASFNLWGSFTFQSKFGFTEGKYGDTLLTSLKNKGFHIWLTMFGFGIPFSGTQYPGEVAALKRYVEYVIARYGAYVSIWEIANEAYADSGLVADLAREIKSLDYEKRPVSTSWEQPDNPSLDIITPHAYSSEPIFETDLWMRNKILEYSGFRKPVLFGEMGNANSSWDQLSALRMRVKSWVAFFHDTILIFWNQSDSRNYYNPTLKNANQFIGEEERAYMRSLTSFTDGISLDVARIAVPSSNPQVRAYGLNSPQETVAYAFHYGNPFTTTTTTLGITAPRAGVLTWYDPGSGSVVAESSLTAGNHVVISPPFTADIALKVTYSAAP